MKDREVSQVKLVYTNDVIISERLEVESDADCYEVFKCLFDADTIDLRESVKALFLNNSNHMLCCTNISEGGTTSSSFDIKLVMQCALLTNAQKIIICHNHPSGDVTPSLNDIKATLILYEACNVMTIELLDHLIIASGDKCFSFKANKLM